MGVFSPILQRYLHVCCAHRKDLGFILSKCINIVHKKLINYVYVLLNQSAILFGGMPQDFINIKNVPWLKK